MKIETQVLDSGAILRLTGRLDAAWAGHFHAAAFELVRDGRHALRIDASGLEYLSSAGLRSLLKIRRELDAVNGSMTILRASPFVRETLRMSGLESLLATDDGLAAAATPSPAPAPATAAPEPGPVAGMEFTRHVLDPAAQAGLHAHAGWMPWNPVRSGDFAALEFPCGRYGLGIGAPGRDAEDARARLGDFVAAAGCLAWMPGDGAENPDYLEQEERFVPRVHAVQALAAEGPFSHLLRFRPEARDACVTLDDLLGQALVATGAATAAAVILAEIDGLVGATLSRSPGAIREGDRPGGFPAIRDWMAFCGERLHRRSQALVVAFAARDPAPPWISALLPSLFSPGLRLHAHAVVLPFRPLPKGVLDAPAAVRAAFADCAPLGLMHLLGDDRPVVGLGQSAFTRGACWCAPLRPPAEVRP